MKQTDPNIVVGSLVELVGDYFTRVGWGYIGDIARVIEVDETSILYKIQIGKKTTWCDADDVKLYVPEAEEQTEEFFFKTQQEIWKYLSENDEHAVIDEEGAVVRFEDGSLTTWHRFTSPEEWKPYTSSEPKEWWKQVPENTEILCWYGDTLSVNTGKPLLLGKIHRSGNEFTTGGNFYWKHAIPVTLEEAKQYILSEILNQ